MSLFLCIDYWNKLLGMELYEQNETSALLGYAKDQVSLYKSFYKICGKGARASQGVVLLLARGNQIKAMNIIIRFEDESCSNFPAQIRLATKITIYKYAF